mgnify:CR=1 FL=1
MRDSCRPLILPLRTRLLLVRHGESIWNREERIQGQADVPLSDLGRRQAEATAAYLAGCGAAAVYASDLVRAVQTAEPIAARLGVGIATDAGLREVHFGEWEGLTLAELRQRDPDGLAAYDRDRVRNRPPGAERLEALEARVGEAMARAIARHAGETLVVVAHGGSLRALLLLLLDLPTTHHFRFITDNCGVSCVEASTLGNRLRYLNDTSHLRGLNGA